MASRKLKEKTTPKLNFLNQSYQSSIRPVSMTRNSNCYSAEGSVPSCETEFLCSPTWEEAGGQDPRLLSSQMPAWGENGKGQGEGDQEPHPRGERLSPCRARTRRGRCRRLLAAFHRPARPFRPSAPRSAAQRTAVRPPQ